MSKIALKLLSGTWSLSIFPIALLGIVFEDRLSLTAGVVQCHFNLSSFHCSRCTIAK